MTRKTDVEYGINLIEGDLPEQAPRSVLEDSLDALRNAGPEAWDKWASIASYKNGSAASAAANVMRQRHGRNGTVEGFDFRTVKQENGRTCLAVRYNPDRVVVGAKEEHEAAEAERKRKLEQKREAEKAAKEQETVKATENSAPAPAPEASQNGGERQSKREKTSTAS